MFTVFPAIDLRNGRVVRLEEGRDDRITTYGDDPVAVAQEFVDAGAEAIHLVDLDAALDRKSTRLNSSHVAISYAVFCLKKKRAIKTPLDIICKAYNQKKDPITSNDMSIAYTLT